jgi:hypothetical protein
VRRYVAATDPAFRAESTAARDLMSVLLGIAVLIGLYVGPVYLIVHRFDRALACLALALAAGAGLYFTWYRNLPPSEKGAPK